MIYFSSLLDQPEIGRHLDGLDRLLPEVTTNLVERPQFQPCMPDEDTLTVPYPGVMAICMAAGAAAAALVFHAQLLAILQ